MRKYIFFILILASCSINNEDNSTSELELTSTILELNPAYYGKGYQFDIYHDFLIILDYSDAEALFKVYSLKDQKYKFDFGKKGGGPNEIITPGSFVIDHKNDKLFIADNGALNIKEFNLKMIPDGVMDAPKTIAQPDEIQLIFFYPIEGNTFITRQLDQSIDLLFKFREDQIIDTISRRFTNQEPILFGDEFTQFYYMFNKHPEKDLYVAAYFSYDVLQIIDGTNDSSFLVQGPEYISYKDRKDEFATYRWTEVGENHIYASYIGKNAVDENGHGNLADKILVFNLSGDLLSTLKLDFPIRYFKVDEKNNLIYALADNENGNFVTFELPKL